MSAARTSSSVSLRAFIRSCRSAETAPLPVEALGPPLDEQAAIAAGSAMRWIFTGSSLSEAAHDANERRDHLGLLLELRLRRHRRALADGGAAHQDRLRDLIVGDRRLPRLVGVVARLGVERGGARAVAGAVLAVAGGADLLEGRARLLGGR